MIIQDKDTIQSTLVYNNDNSLSQKFNCDSSNQDKDTIQSTLVYNNDNSLSRNPEKIFLQSSLHY